MHEIIFVAEEVKRQIDSESFGSPIFTEAENLNELAAVKDAVNIISIIVLIINK